jgi:hypothetical protein
MVLHLSIPKVSPPLAHGIQKALRRPAAVRAAGGHELASKALTIPVQSF